MYTETCRKLKNILLIHLKQLMAQEQAIRNGRLDLFRGNRKMGGIYPPNNGFIRHLPNLSNKFSPAKVRKFAKGIPLTLVIMVDLISLIISWYTIYSNVY